MKKFIIIVLLPLIALLAMAANKFFTWLDRQLGWVAMGGR